MLSLKKEREIFAYLFDIAKFSDDEEGIVCACLTNKEGAILTSNPSFNDGRHAEYVVLKQLKEAGIEITLEHILYTTLEPCGFRNRQQFPNCTDLIINSGIKHIVYAAKDLEYSQDTAKRFRKAGITYKQVADSAIVKQAKNLFNTTIRTHLSKMQLPRKRGL